MKKPFVFISYSSKDATLAHQLCTFIEKNDIKCWIASRDVLAGENYAEQIVNAIDACSVFFIIVTESSSKSKHVGNEISLAFDTGKKIIPFRSEKYEPAGSFKYYFQHIQWIDAYVDINNALIRLIETIGTVIPLTNDNIVMSHVEITPPDNDSDWCTILKKIDMYTNEFKSNPSAATYEKLSQAIDEFDLEFAKIPLSKRGAFSQEWSFVKIQRDNIKRSLTSTAFVVMLADQILSFVAKIYSVLSD